MRNIFNWNLNYRRNWILPLDDFFEQIFLGASFEWLLSKKHCVKQNSSSPHISSRPIIRIFGANFRRHVGRRATKNLHLLMSLSCESEIYNLCGVIQRVTHVYHDVFWFQVSVSNLLLVETGQRFYYLTKNFSACFFWKNIIFLFLKYVI